jgi:ribosomal protein S18 acetylase RimI-like enzyme
MDLRWLSATDEAAVAAARALFDHEPRPLWTQEFLAQPSHHLGVVYVDGRPAGFVSGVEMTHPDKGTEMFLYELGVDDEFQGRGIGKALVAALAQRARERSCYGMWALTEADNTAAIRTYLSAGGTDQGAQVMLDWRLEPSSSESPGAAGEVR